MIEVENLTKSYRGSGAVTEVLHGITFRIEPGEYVAIMGASGSGKSTLLNILGFLDRPDEGRTIVMVTHDPAVAERAKRVIVLERGRIVSDATGLAPAAVTPA